MHLYKRRTLKRGGSRKGTKRSRPVVPSQNQLGEPSVSIDAERTDQIMADRDRALLAQINRSQTRSRSRDRSRSSSNSSAEERHERKTKARKMAHHPK